MRARQQSACGPTLRLTKEGIWDGADSIREDAELGNVLLEMFSDNYGDVQETFTEAIIRCALDELTALEYAVNGSDNELTPEIPRMLERIQHRLKVARWLDRRLKDERGLRGPEAEHG